LASAAGGVGALPFFGADLWTAFELSWLTPRGKDERAGWGMFPHLAVPDVAETAARMQKAGYKIVQPPKEYSQFTEAFIADPDGYTWALFHWKTRLW